MQRLTRGFAYLLTAALLIAAMTGVMFATLTLAIGTTMPIAGKVVVVLIGASALATAVFGGERLIDAAD